MNFGPFRKVLLGQPQRFTLATDGTAKRVTRKSGCLWHAIFLEFCRPSIYRRSSTMRLKAPCVLKGWAMDRSRKIAIGILAGIFALFLLGISTDLLKVKSSDSGSSEERSIEGNYDVVSLPGGVDPQSAAYWQSAFAKGDMPGWLGLEERGRVVAISSSRVHVGEPIGGLMVVIVESGPLIGERFYVGEGVFRCFVLFKGCDAFPFMRTDADAKTKAK